MLYLFSSCLSVGGLQASRRVRGLSHKGKEMETTVLFRDLGFGAQGHGDLVSRSLMKYLGYYSQSIIQLNIAGCWPSPNPSLRP